jgi:hypothetical protein
MKLNPATLARIAELTGTKLPVISEADFTDAVIQFARDHGWKAAHFRTVRVQRRDGSVYYETPVQADGRGWRDLILARPPRLIAPELKVGRNKQTPDQAAWQAVLEACGIPAPVWRWPDDWDEIERVLS